MKFIHSIRWRVQIWHSLLLTIIVVAFGIFFYMHEKHRMVSSIDTELQSRIPLLFPHFSVHDRGNDIIPDWSRTGQSRPKGGKHGKRADKHHPPRGHDPRKMVDLQKVYTDEGYFFAVWRDLSQPAFAMSELTPPTLSPVTKLKSGRGSQLRDRENFREAYNSTPSLPCIIVGYDLNNLSPQLNTLKWRISGVCCAVLLLSYLIGWQLTGVIVKPFRLMREAASRVASGDLEARVCCNIKYGETGELADSLNYSFEQLEHSFELQRRFTADASHELRSPIAALVMQVQAANRKTRTLEDYQKLFKGCKHSTEHLQRLSNELLDLSILDAGITPPEKNQHSAKSLLAQSIDTIQPRIDQHQAQIILPDEDIDICVDSESVSRVFINLINNAIIHSDSPVTVTVSLSAAEDSDTIRIEDDGPGIAEEQIDTLFERFSRGEKSRAQRSVSSTGLGLAITKSIVNAHGGEISIYSKLGNGTQVTITLPSR